MSPEANFLPAKTPLEKGENWATGGGASPRASGGVPPSLSISNNCTEKVAEVEKLLLGHKRMAEVLTIEIQALARKYGIERLGFLTLTFSGAKSPSIRTARKRFHSLNTHVLRGRYEKSIAVIERGDKTGRLHFHLVVVLPCDIRTGVDFAEIEKGVYTSAGPYLRQEWAFWRKTAPSYKFGRTELLPVRSTAEGIARYVGGYIAKHVNQRHEEDKGARMVSFIGYKSGQRTAYPRFAWNSPGGWLWRKKLEVFCAKYEVDMPELKRLFGPRWCYLLQDSIMAIDLGKELGEVQYPSGRHAQADGVAMPEGADLEAPCVKKAEKNAAIRKCPTVLDPILIPKYWETPVRIKWKASQRSAAEEQRNANGARIREYYERIELEELSKELHI